MHQEEGRVIGKVSPDQFFGHKTFPSINVDRKHLFTITCLFSNEHKNFCCKNLHANETLGFYLQPVANWSDTGHPVISPWTPKISPFNAHMAFYSTTVLRFWGIYKSLRHFLKKKITQRGTGGSRWIEVTVRNRAPLEPRTNPWRPLIEKRERETDRKEGRKKGRGGEGREGKGRKKSEFLCCCCA